MIDLENGFEEQLVLSFKTFQKKVPLANLKTYVKREAIPQAKKDIQYYENHYENEKKRFRGVTMEEEWFQDKNGNYYKEERPFCHGSISWVNGKIVNHEQMTENEHNHCLEKIHYAERYLNYLEEVLQGSIKIDLTKDEHPLFIDKMTFNEWVKNLQNDGKLDKTRWTGKGLKKRDRLRGFAMLIFLMMDKGIMKNQEATKIHAFFLNDLGWENIGSVDSLRNYLQEHQRVKIDKLSKEIFAEVYLQIKNSVEP